MPNFLPSRGAKPWLYGFYGLLIGAIFPISVTMIQLSMEGQVLNLVNFINMHKVQPCFMIVDLVPLVLFVLFVSLGKQNQQLELLSSELLRWQDDSEEKHSILQSVMDHTPWVYAIIDKEFNLQLANNAISEFIDEEPHQIIGQKCYDLLGNGTICPGCAVAKAFISKKPEKFTKLEKAPDGSYRTVSITAVPIIANDRVENVMEIVTNISEQAEMIKQREADLVATIDALVGLIEVKDSYTGGHSQRVRTWAVGIAQAMGLDPYTINDIEIAACLHDIGKIGIANIILNKPSSLTTGEFENVKRHPVIGQDTLSCIDSFRNASKIIRHHHETFDGGGYPDGLKGNEIPLGSRIICVADAYDAMISNRSYRSAMSKEKAIEELRKGIGTQFDSEVTKTFIRLIKE